jgi:hypothetical protein
VVIRVREVANLEDFPSLARKRPQPEADDACFRMDDPSQSAAMAAGRQDRATEEKHRALIQQGSLTGLVERNSKWDVEYEGKDAKGTLVRPFEPGFGDSRALPSKMLGPRQAVERGS